MNIDTKQLKELRERTGAGIMDCKKALEANNSDMEASIKWLREKGIAKAVKKASRVSAEGVFSSVAKENEVLLYEVNCETDFVASNEKFKNLVNELGQVLAQNNVKNTEEALEAKNAKGETVKEMLLGTIAVIGENITLRNVKVITKTPSQVFGIYKHFDNKKLVVVVLEGGDEEVGKKVAMHICVSNPTYLNREAVDQAYLDSEREIITKEATQENPGKPANILEKMIEGRLQKELKAVCLVDQPFAIDPNQTVGQYLASNKATVVSYSRNEVGEGVQKKENNFAEEVYSQIKQA